MIYFYTINGLGNQIWQYLSVRYYAELNNLAVTYQGHLPTLDDHDTNLFVLDQVFTNIVFPTGDTLYGTPIVFNNVMKFPPKSSISPIIICSLSEHADNLPSRAIIKRWLRPKPVTISRQYHTIVHIRLGDWFKLIYGNDTETGVKHYQQFYHQAISNLDLSNAAIVTDSPTHPLIKQINKYNLPIVSNTWLYDWHTIYQAKVVVHGISSYSLWSAYLGNTTTIYRPSKTNDLTKYLKTKCGATTKQPYDVNHHIVDHRYIDV